VISIYVVLLHAHRVLFLSILYSIFNIEYLDIVSNMNHCYSYTTKIKEYSKKKK